MSSTGAMFTAIAAIVVSVIGGYFGWRNSGRASMSADQRAWLQTAMDEARKAKTEANSAEESAGRAARAATEATNRADSAERRLNHVEHKVDDLVQWIVKVVDAAHEVDSDQVIDPQVRRLLDVVNGGPPTLTADRLRIPPRG